MWELGKVSSTFEKLSGARMHLEQAVEWNGSKWLVGSTFNKKYEYPLNLSDLMRWYPLVAKFLVREAQKRGIERIDTMAVSVPVEDYYEDTITGRKLITQLMRSIQEETAIVDIKVLPQGIISLYEIYNQGALKPDTTLVIDGGFYTINVCIADKYGSILYAKSYYNELGIRDLLENYLLPEVKVRYPEMPKDLQYLKNIFLTSQIDTGFKTIDITEEKRNALNSYIEALFQRLTKDIERERKHFNQFAVIGGLAYYIPEIETNKPYFIPKENKEFYTVLGMHNYPEIADIPNRISVDFGFGDIKFIISGE